MTNFIKYGWLGKDLSDWWSFSEKTLSDNRYYKFENGKFELEFELPGVKKEDIKISNEGSALKIEYLKKGKQVIRIEQFEEVLDPALIKAKLENGVLYLTLHSKPKEGEKKFILIE